MARPAWLGTAQSHSPEIPDCRGWEGNIHLGFVSMDCPCAAALTDPKAECGALTHQSGEEAKHYNSIFLSGELHRETSVRLEEKIRVQIFQPWKCPINVFPTSLCME